jgi:glycosyltransferase involved in cell wall biosynthesis
VRVLAFGIWSQGPEYPRPANLIGGLRDAGAEVTECRYAMAGDFSRRLRSVRGVAGPLGFALSLLAGVPVLAWRFLRAPRSDLILLQHPGIFHLHLARFLRLFAHRRAPIALDLFFSLHEALAADRRLLAPGSAAARALFLLERSACRGADLVLTDTRAHAEWAAGYFGLPAAKVLPIPVGPAFPPSPSPADLSADLSAEVPPMGGTKAEVPPMGGTKAEPFTVLFVGTYIPLHGIETILGAAALLADEPGVRFLMVGKGQLREEMERRAREKRTAPMEFRDWVATAGLPALYRSCSLALGVFGVTEKAGRVIPSKVYDICAAGVPFITADSPAIREAFRDGENACLVPPGDPEALARGILRLKADPSLRRALAAGAHRAALGPLSRQAIGAALLEKPPRS